MTTITFHKNVLSKKFSDIGELIEEGIPIKHIVHHSLLLYDKLLSCGNKLKSNLKHVLKKLSSFDEYDPLNYDSDSDSDSDLDDISETIKKPNSDIIMATIKEEFASLKEKMFGTSIAKGRTGEIICKNWIEKEFPDYSVEYKNQEAYSADMKIYTDFGNILVEVKNWERAVSILEIDKFKRDIFADEAKFGIFASFGRIAGKKRYEIINVRNKWLLYIPNCNKIAIKLGVLLLRSISSLGSNLSDTKQILKSILGVWKYQSSKAKKSMTCIERELNKINANIQLIDKEMALLELE